MRGDPGKNEALGVENRDSAELGSKITRIHQQLNYLLCAASFAGRWGEGFFSPNTTACVKKRRKKTEEAGARCEGRAARKARFGWRSIRRRGCRLASVRALRRGAGSRDHQREAAPFFFARKRARLVTEIAWLPRQRFVSASLSLIWPRLGALRLRSRRGLGGRWGARR